MLDETRDDLPLDYEQPDLWDRLIALFLGGVVVLLLAYYPYGGVHPNAWTDLAVASGTVPPETMRPALARILEWGAIRLFGLDALLPIVRYLGVFCGAISAACFYLIMRECLPSVLPLRNSGKLWAFRVERLVMVTGVVVFLCAEPVARLFHSFTANTLFVTLAFILVRGFFRLLHYGRFSTAFGVLFLAGVLTAESPFGLLLTVILGALAAVARHYAWRPDLRYLNPMLVELFKWRLSFCFLLGFLGTLVLDGAFYVYKGGYAVAHVGVIRSVLDAAWAYVLEFAQAATLLGWALIVGVVLVPFVVALLLIRRATDDDQLLSYRMGLIFLALFVVSWVTFATLPYLHFWSWTHNPIVVSDCLLAGSAVFQAATFTLALAVIFFDIWCRDHIRILLQRFPDFLDDGVELKSHFHWKWQKTITVIVLAIVALSVAPGKRDRALVEMTRLLADTLRLVVAECGNARVLFTNGAQDDALRLEVRRQGKNLVPLSMLGDRSARAVYLRQRAAQNDEDRALLALGAPNALRAWVKDTTNRFNTVALELGFEIWRNNRAARPVIGGLVACAGRTAADAAPFIQQARQLGERILALYKKGLFAKCEDRLVREKLLFVQWRLARMAALRTEDADAHGLLAEAQKDALLLQELDANNSELQRVREAVDWMRRTTGDALTPREGLRVALERADFKLARRYATPILNASPTDANANFAMGMSYFVEEKFATAEKYLLAALVNRPNEPAILNNLAICFYKTHRAAQAFEYAKRALALLPDAPAVRATYDEIEKTVKGKDQPK